MTRVKRGVTKHRRHQKIIKLAKGYRGSHKSSYKQAKAILLKAWQYTYCHRRLRKRDFRRLWIIRINAACRQAGLRYSEFIHQLQGKMIKLDRKILAELAATKPAIFEMILKKIKP
ncbi:50S ribosomal protein L20 [Candidatus Peregrinibacteria bacterium CG1_02_41_10]|nr:MAG: 50S ribosomal protein L20 [Candidatus Peregrinibacteria bacterium CG1_02_41_10]